MKKIIFLLLATVSTYAQVSNGRETKFTNGIRNTASQTVTEPINLVTEGADGTYGKVLRSNLKDVIEVTNYASLPVTGVVAKLYVTQDTNKLYRWNGTDYVDVSNTDLTGVELQSNKSGTLTASSTLYPNNNAVIAGLATKQNTISGTANVVPKYGTGGLVASNFSDSGTLTSSSTDMTINSLRVGRGAGNSTLNVTMGTNSLISNTGGTNNLAIGSTAMRFNTTGSNNTAMAGRALENNISGGNNVGLGFGALLLNNSGNQNIGIGSSSIANSTVGNENIGIGFASLFNMTSGSSNTAIGESAGRYISNGSSSATSIDNSTFIGYRARPSDNGQSNQIAIGYDAIGLGTNTTVIGNSSTSFGRWWGNMLLGTSSNNGRRLQVVGGADIDNLVLTTTPTTSMGSPDIVTRNPTTGAVESVPYSVIAVPSQLESNATDLTVWNNGKGNVVNNTSFGDGALKQNTTGQQNTAIGNNALSSVTSSSQNTALGSSAMGNGGGSSNTAIGGQALQYNNSNGTTAIGQRAGLFATGSVNLTNTANSVYIGIESQAGANNVDNEIVIGAGAIGAGSGTATLGNTSITKTVLRGVIQQTTYTVATLPTGTLGMFAVVTDALAPTYLGTLVGGGSVKCPVFYNGSAWVSH